MPSTADQLVAAARVNFGKPKDERATHFMEAWLNSGCRDWRRETGEGVPDGDTVVSAVFAKPVQAQKLRMQLAQNVKRWGFLRQGHQPANLNFITIEKYMEGPPGKLVGGRVHALLNGAVQKHAERVGAAKRKREQLQAERLAAFVEKQRKKAAPELWLALKGFWANASEERSEKNRAVGRNSFREDPNKKLRRITRNVDFEMKDDYTEEGEPIWERIDLRYART